MSERRGGRIAGKHVRHNTRTQLYRLRTSFISLHAISVFEIALRLRTRFLITAVIALVSVLVIDIAVDGEVISDLFELP